MEVSRSPAVDAASLEIGTPGIRGRMPTDAVPIPKDWVCVSVGEIAARRQNAIVGGPFGSDLVSKDYASSGVPVVRGQNMSGYVVSGDFVFVSKEKARKLQANVARPGDIIFTQRGTLGQVALIPSEPFEEYVVSQSQMKLTVNPDLVSESYILQYFISVDGQRQILESAIQTGVPHTNLGILRNYRIPFPPTRAEQEAIAKALSDADSLIESLEKLLIKKRQIKQGAMQGLLTGNRRLPGFEISVGYKRTEIGMLPKDWSPRRLNEGVQLISGHHVLAKHCNSQGDGVAYITGPSDFPDGVIRHTKYTTAPTTICARDDILITVKGSGTGSLVRSNAKYCISRQLMAIRVQRWSAGYIYFSLLRDESLFGTAAAGLIPGLSRSDILNKVVPVPSTIAEQEAIAAVLSDMDTEITALESKLAKARQIKQGMMQELLTGRIRLV